ncbi:hypothetical protein [Pisciglobus halotolerans]|uniref:Uncharacterized protein n=1 Tax=Pisciglobus halotolerans TaxID=745365 RepID=A0A1I3DMA1_9LACT|nr:hypothetical protein [Pisciglobus halotolerans]SFH87803.1 hypothetical protein SAMN04489868_1442 [Pisciglobus halotolerans]
MHLDEVSFVILSQESAEVKQIMHQLVNSRFQKQNQLNISIIPFLSSVCDGWLNLFELKNQYISLPKIENISLDKIIKATRVSYKLYSDRRHNKINNNLHVSGLERLDILKTDYNMLQKKWVEIFGQKDLGVFTINNIPYGNTSQLSIYLEKILNLKSSSSLYTLQKNSAHLLTSYSKYIGFFISSVVSLPYSELVDEKKRLSLDSSNLRHNDYFFYDEKRKNLLGGNLPTDTQLFLFNILCQNNFVNLVIPNVFLSSESLFYRSKLQVYLTSINCLSLILKKYSDTISKKQIQDIKYLITEKEKYFTFENKLRNNIFHYVIQDIPLTVFTNSNYYFQELVEYSVGIGFDRFISNIDNSFISINQVISGLIQYSINN